MPGESAARQRHVRALQKLVKRALGFGRYGSSCKLMEAATDRAARRLLGRFTAEETAEYMVTGMWPEWLTDEEAAKEHFSPTVAAAQPLADKGGHTKQKYRVCRAVEISQQRVDVKEENREEALALKATRKFKHVSLSTLKRRVARTYFGQINGREKQEYYDQYVTRRHQSKVRRENGQFGRAEDLDEQPVMVLAEREALPTTPTKKKCRAPPSTTPLGPRALQQLGAGLIKFAGDNLSTPIKHHSAESRQQRHSYRMQSATKQIVSGAIHSGNLGRNAVRRCKRFMGLDRVRSDFASGCYDRPCKVSDAALFENLKEKALPSTYFSKRYGKQFWTLAQSKNSLAHTIHGLGLKKSQLKKRVRGGKIGILTFKQQKGRCDCCAKWQSAMGGPALTWFHDLFRGLQARTVVLQGPRRRRHALPGDFGRDFPVCGAGVRVRLVARRDPPRVARPTSGGGGARARRDGLHGEVQRQAARLAAHEHPHPA